MMERGTPVMILKVDCVCMGSKKMHITPRHIAAGFCFGLLVLHVWSAFISGIPKMFLMHAIAFVYDVSLLGMSTIILNRLVGRNYITMPPVVVAMLHPQTG
jgi:hypothetical protein